MSGNPDRRVRRFLRIRLLAPHGAASLPGQDVRNALVRNREAAGAYRVRIAISEEPLARICSDDSGAHAREIEQNTRFQLLRVEAVLHQITDAHDAP